MSEWNVRALRGAINVKGVLHLFVSVYVLCAHLISYRGWVNGLQQIGRREDVGGKAVAGCMLIVGALFTTLAILDIIYLQKVIIIVHCFLLEWISEIFICIWNKYVSKMSSSKVQIHANGTGGTT